MCEIYPEFNIKFFISCGVYSDIGTFPFVRSDVRKLFRYVEFLLHWFSFPEVDVMERTSGLAVSDLRFVFRRVPFHAATCDVV